MMIAVALVGVVQMAIDEVIYVIAVRNGFMAAAGAVDVRGFMRGTGVPAGAIRRIVGAHFQGVFVIVALVGMVQVAVMDKIHVAVVKDGGMAASGAMLVGMIFVSVVVHDFLALSGLPGADFSVACARALKIRPETCWSARE